LNATIPQAEIDAEYAANPAWASAEYGGQFRADLEAFVSREIVDACVDDVAERPYERGLSYCGFVDPSGGSSDSMTLGIAHCEEGITVLDLVREAVPPFSPAEVVEEFAGLLRAYGLTRCFGDKYAVMWVTEQFAMNGVTYEHTDQTRSELYGSLLPMLNSRTVALLNNDRLQRQLLQLERSPGRGRDNIDHPRGAHDDVANAAAGALVLARLEPAAVSVPGFNRPIEYVNQGLA
jgi:hypothetical protein